MTLLGAYLEDAEQIIVAADRLLSTTDSTGTSGFGFGQKWSQVGELPFMFGLCGSGHSELIAQNWILGWVPHLDSWEDAAESARTSIRAINGAAPNPSLYIEVMLAGFIGGEPGILAISATGNINFPDFTVGTEARFMGLSCWGVELAWRWHNRSRGIAASPDSFFDLFLCAQESDPLLVGVDLWTVKPGGCSLVRSQDYPGLDMRTP